MKKKAKKKRSAKKKRIHKAYDTQEQEESDLERKFRVEWGARYPQALPLQEYIFHPTRKWRFDFAWPNHKLAVEVQGLGPGHCSEKGMTNDYQKHWAAIELGWTVVFINRNFLFPSNIHETVTRVGKMMKLEEVQGYIPLRKRS